MLRSKWPHAVPVIAALASILFCVRAQAAPPSDGYQAWCGVYEVLKATTVDTAKDFIRSKDDPQRFVRQGDIIFVLAPTSKTQYFGVNRYRRYQPVVDCWHGRIDIQCLDPRDELLRIDEPEFKLRGAGALRRGGANDDVRELIGATRPLATIPFTARPRVAILDSIVFAHPEFVRPGPKPTSLVSWYPLDPNLTDMDCDGGDCCRKKSSPPPISSPHATQVAGLIAASEDGKGISGLGEAAELMSTSVHEVARGCFGRRQLVAGYKCATQLKADIVNISMQSEVSRARPVDFEDAVTSAARNSQRTGGRGTLVVVAAGNRYCDFDGNPPCSIWPGSTELDTIVSVEALQLDGVRVPSSSRGKTVDLGVPAPAEGLCTTSSENPANPEAPDCSKGYEAFGQTSAAAALVTGAATRVWGHPNFDRCSAAQLRRVLRGYGKLWPNMAPSCLLQMGFLYEVRRNADGSVMDLCNCPEIASSDDCGTFATKPLCGTTAATRSDTDAQPPAVAD